MKTPLLAILLVAGLALNAQTEKGRFLIGGSADVSSSMQATSNGHTTRGFNLSIAPSFGVFVVKGFAIGGRYSLGVTNSKVYDVKAGEYKSTLTFTSAIGPLLKYYLGKKALKGVASANAAYLTSVTLRNGGSVSGTDGFSVTGFLGMAFFLNPHISLESGLYVTGQGYKKQLPLTRIGFSVGFFALLDKKKKE